MHGGGRQIYSVESCYNFRGWGYNSRLIRNIKYKWEAFFMKVIIVEGCISCGLCESVCPEVFKLNDDGISEVIADPEEEDEDNVREAAEGCPVNVIIIEEKDEDL